MEFKQTKITITDLLPYYKDYITVIFKADGLDLPKTEKGEHKLVLRKENILTYLNMNLPVECMLVHDRYFIVENTYITSI